MHRPYREGQNLAPGMLMMTVGALLVVKATPVFGAITLGIGALGLATSATLRSQAIDPSK